MGYKILDENGNEVSIDSLPVEELPEELVTKHPAYKKVLDESIRRRQEIKKLKENQVVQAVEPPVEEQETDKRPSPVSAFDINDLRQKILEEVMATFEAKQREKQERAALVQKIIAEEGVPPSVASVLEQLPNEETMRNAASAIAKAGLRFDPTPTGGNGQATELTAMQEKVLKRLFK